MKALRYIACLYEFMGPICMALGGDHGIRIGIGSQVSNDCRGEISRSEHDAGTNLAEL